MLETVHVDNASDVEENDYLAEIVGDVIEIVFLFVSQIIVALFRLSVSSFRGISGNNKDSCIACCLSNVFLSDKRHDRCFKSHLKIYARSRNSALSCNRFDLVHVSLDGRIVDLIVSVEPADGCYVKTCVDKSVADGDVVSGVNFAGSAASSDGVSCTVTVNGNSSGFCYR